MLIYIWRDNQQEGPFAENEIRTKVQSGELHRNVLAWAQGCEGWTPLSEVLQLDGRLENPEIAKVPSVKVLPAAQEGISRTKQSGNKLLAKLVVAASLLKVHSFRRKREWVDLRMAEFRVGVKAYSSGVLLSGQEDLATRLIEVQLSLASLKDVVPGSRKNPFVKVKRCFGSLGRAMSRVVLVLKKNRLLRALGAALRKADCAAKSWAMEASEANGIGNEIRILEEKMKDLERNTYPWARRPMWLATLFLVLVVGGIVIAMVSGPAGRAFSQAPLALDTGSAKFKAFESQFKAFMAAHPNLVKLTADEQKTLGNLVRDEATREISVSYPKLSQLPAAEQTRIRTETGEEVWKFLITNGDVPDYFGALVAKQLNIAVPTIPSPPERSGPEFDAFVAKFKVFWAAHSDPSTFTTEDGTESTKMYEAELDRELKITHPEYNDLPVAEQTKLREELKGPLIMALFAKGGLPANVEAYSKKLGSVSPSPSPSPAESDSSTDGPSAALYLTVNGVKEAVCTKDGHLTPKYKTRAGALPLVREVFHVLAPAANCYTNHATQLGDITGADDAFRGFHEATSDNGQKKWIYAEFEASIDFANPDGMGYGDLQNDLMDVAIVVELNPTNMFILDADAYRNWQSAGDVVWRRGRGVLWYQVK